MTPEKCWALATSRSFGISGKHRKPWLMIQKYIFQTFVNKFNRIEAKPLLWDPHLHSNICDILDPDSVFWHSCSFGSSSHEALLEAILISLNFFQVRARTLDVKLQGRGGVWGQRLHGPRSESSESSKLSHLSHLLCLSSFHRRGGCGRRRRICRQTWTWQNWRGYHRSTCATSCGSRAALLRRPSAARVEACGGERCQAGAARGRGFCRPRGSRSIAPVAPRGVEGGEVRSATGCFLWPTRSWKGWKGTGCTVFLFVRLVIARHRWCCWKRLWCTTALRPSGPYGWWRHWGRCRSLWQNAKPGVLARLPFPLHVLKSFQHIGDLAEKRSPIILPGPQMTSGWYLWVAQNVSKYFLKTIGVRWNRMA